MDKKYPLVYFIKYLFLVWKSIIKYLHWYKCVNVKIINSPDKFIKKLGKHPKDQLKFN